MTLYHYTCAHHADQIAREGYVKAAGGILATADAWAALSALPPSSWFAWFTDLAVPNRNALGLTSRILSCDRTERRFRVTDETEVARWVEERRWHPILWPLEAAPGAMPMHWWLAAEPVPVVPA